MLDVSMGWIYWHFSVIPKVSQLQVYSIDRLEILKFLLPHITEYVSCSIPQATMIGWEHVSTILVHLSLPLKNSMSALVFKLILHNRLKKTYLVILMSCCCLHTYILIFWYKSCYPDICICCPIFDSSRHHVVINWCQGTICVKWTLQQSHTIELEVHCKCLITAHNKYLKHRAMKVKIKAIYNSHEKLLTSVITWYS